jgi:hypothetical protein
VRVTFCRGEVAGGMSAARAICASWRLRVVMTRVA